MEGLLQSYREVRDQSLAITAPLEVEDYTVQSMDDASPPKWHLAHTTWFFETFLLEPYEKGFKPHHPRFRVLFNSYYQSVGAQHARPQRGILSRPSIQEIRAYRAAVDERMSALLGRTDDPEILHRVTIGLHHEQQHQELLLMDIKHNLWANPLRPTYRADLTAGPADINASPHAWHSFEGGQVAIGHSGAGFCFDNEAPRHDVLVRPFELACRPVTSGEWLEFMLDGGYERPELWLSDGWSRAADNRWKAPLYWEHLDGAWHVFTLGGQRPLCLTEPVVHVSYYEANAFAGWRNARLPTECEWELAASKETITGNFVETGNLHPVHAASDAHTLQQLYGDVWEHTASPYVGYPGYKIPKGALGEYNGKFMCGQWVQRGGSCVTPKRHIRATYRNFFYPWQRWNFQGLRLARCT